MLLAGRRFPNEIMQKSISALNSKYAADVRAVQLDVSDFNACKELIQVKIPEMGLPGLRGVMHAAGILQDGLIENQNWENLSSPFNAKVNGTLNLHELTKDLNLEHFVLFSSVASLIGAPGQSNHAAGNNFEDAMAHYRHSIGLTATSVNWGQWGEVGVAKEIDVPGLKPFSTQQALAALEYALKNHRVHTGVINLESLNLMSKFYPHLTNCLDEWVCKHEVVAVVLGLFT